MKCRRCQKQAVVALPSHNTAFCADCYLLFFKRQVEKAIKDHKLLTQNDKVLVAISGGKDSLALTWQLANLGYDVTGLHIDLAIPDSSEKAREITTNFCKKFNIKLKILEIKNEGLAIPEVKKRIRRPVCSVCGQIKRYYFNKFALDHGFTVLATGHNLNDEVARLLSNTLRWDTAYLSDQGPLLPAENGFMRKVKPLYRLTEFETANLCYLVGIEYGFTPCPYSSGASFTYYKQLLDELEFNQPGRKLQFYEGFLKRGQKAFKLLEQKQGQELNPCPECGYPTSGELCGVCRIKKMMGVMK